MKWKRNPLTKRKKLPYWYWLAGTLSMLLIILTVVMECNYYKMMNYQAFGEDVEESIEYKYHCAYITKDQNNLFLNSIYEGAKEEGKAYGIYVENFGERFSVKYSVEDGMKIAIAAGVDAIIVEGEKSTEMTNLVAEAVDKGIAVIMVHKDNAGSRRQSFIGVNDYQIGYEICAKATEYMDFQEGKIHILYSDTSTKHQDYIILEAGIQKYLVENSSKATLEAQYISGREAYDIQAEIRSLLRNKEKRPKILVCTNMIQTQCAYQTVLDLECEGEVKIIGFFDSQTIREAMERDVILATTMIDTNQMGKEAVKSIHDYLLNGYTNDYVSVDVTLMDKNDLQQDEETKQAG